MPFICHDTLMTCVPVLEDEQFKFPWRVILANFCSNWFKLVSANPPNSKTLKQKNSCCYTFQDWLLQNLFGLGFDNGCLAKSHMEVSMWCLQKFDLITFKSIACLGFSNVDKFYQGWNFGCFWWNFSNNNLICCTYQNLFTTSTFFLFFFS